MTLAIHLPEKIHNDYIDQTMSNYDLEAVDYNIRILHKEIKEKVKTEGFTEKTINEIETLFNKTIGNFNTEKDTYTKKQKIQFLEKKKVIEVHMKQLRNLQKKTYKKTS